MSVAGTVASGIANGMKAGGASDLEAIRAAWVAMKVAGYQEMSMAELRAEGEIYAIFRVRRKADLIDQLAAVARRQAERYQG
jgi:hypothetical protein